ncbi:MFS transporter [Pseudalkalibacillus hwajinpoensis]|uniref:MFS transporter n=1 Tax=Guptibacillus hwajinpoensis TaxID=208199 RepID=UPI00325B21EF
MRAFVEIWKYHAIVLACIGISNVGGWVYHIALNLIILDQTGSALAVTGLYLLKPLAILFTNSWSGSLIDRMKKRNLMIGLNVLQASLIVCLPFLSSLWFIYALVLIINMANAMFHPTSMIYITKLIPIDERKRFNSFRSLIDSGAFLIGPAIAGLLFMIGTPDHAIYVNAISLCIAGILIGCLPEIEGDEFVREANVKISIATLREDWRVVNDFSRRSRYVVTIYFLFSAVTVMTWGVDSLEAAFAKEVLQLTNTAYGLLVSIAGGGILVGAIMNTLFVKKLSTSLLMGLGSILLALGYLVFAISTEFSMAAIGCFVLSFSLAFANTGFYTFYQNNIPVEIMGRIGSLFGFVEALFTIFVIILCGLLAQLVSIHFSVIVGVIIMFIFAVAVFISLFLPSNHRSYKAREIVK